MTVDEITTQRTTIGLLKTKRRMANVINALEIGKPQHITKQQSLAVKKA